MAQLPPAARAGRLVSACLETAMPTPADTIAAAAADRHGPWWDDAGVRVLDRVCAEEGYAVIGVDEAGRGPLIGSLFACAVLLPADRSPALEALIGELDDSKRLSARRREALAPRIAELTDAAVVEMNARTIDECGINPAKKVGRTRHL